MTDSTERFSNRVENYVKYRPHYPPEIVALLRAECGLTGESLIADIGSGTGILAELFLQHGHTVIGVEPNGPMRAAAERLLGGNPHFHSVNGTAEATTLADRSVDMITAGQAFHWFDVPRARAEFARILRPGGYVVLVWNERQHDTTPFLRAYERLLQDYGTDYRESRHTAISTEEIAAFFAPSPMRTAHVPNTQHFDYAGLEGRLLSSSYTPEPGHPQYAPMLRELRRIFDAHQQNGQVALLYTTSVYYGQLA